MKQINIQKVPREVLEEVVRRFVEGYAFHVKALNFQIDDVKRGLFTYEEAPALYWGTGASFFRVSQCLLMQTGFIDDKGDGTGFKLPVEVEGGAE